MRSDLMMNSLHYNLAIVRFLGTLQGATSSFDDRAPRFIRVLRRVGQVAARRLAIAVRP
jgi:hypothetical protein